MNARGHYAEAERLIDPNSRDGLETALYFAEAQIHATLAVAAATIDLAEVAMEATA